MDAFSFGAVEEPSVAAAQALLADFPGVGVEQLVVGTDQLEIVSRVHDPALAGTFLLPFHDLDDDRRRELIVEVVDMDDIRLEIIQDNADFPTGLPRIDCPEGVADF